MGRRANGEGSVYRRADGKWCAQVIVDGKKVRRYTRSRKEALAALDVMRGRVKDGQAPKDSRATLGAVVEAWMAGPLELKKVAQGTRRTYKSQGHQIIKEAGDRAVGSLRRTDIEKMLLDMRDRGLSGQTLSSRLTVIRSVFRDYAIPNGLVAIDPTVGIPKPDTSRKRAFHLPSLEDTEAVIAAANGPLATAVRIMSMTGIRPGECLALNWEHVDFENGSLLIPGTKTASSRRVLPLPQQLADELLEWRATFPVTPIGGPIIADPNGKRVPSDRLAKEMQAIRDELNLPGLTQHSWRHAAATVMLEQGVPDSVAAEVLGHSTPAVTRAIYQHVSRVLATDALEKVASKSRRTGS